MQPSPDSILLLLRSPGHYLVWILALIFNLLSLLPISHLLEQQPSLEACIMSPLPSVPSTSSEPCCLRARTLSNIYWADCSQPGPLHWEAQIIKMPLPLHFDISDLLCHQASHLLRATNLVLTVTWHAPSHPKHDCIQTSHHPWVSGCFSV